MVTKSHYNLQSWKQDDGFDLTHAHVYTWICSRLPPPKKNTIPCKWPTWIQMVDEPLGKYQIIIIKSRCHIIFPNKTQYFMAIVWLLHCFFNGFLHVHPCPRALKKRPPPRCTKGQRLVQYRAILGTSCIVVTCFIPSGLLSNKTMYMYNMHIYIHTYIHTYPIISG